MGEGLKVGMICRVLKFHRKGALLWEALSVPKQRKRGRPVGKIYQIKKELEDPEMDLYYITVKTFPDPPFPDIPPQEWMKEFRSLEEAIAAARKDWGGQYKRWTRQ